MTHYIHVSGAPDTYGLPVGDGSRLLLTDDLSGAVAAADAAGYSIQGYGPADGAPAVFRSTSTSTADLRLWDYLATDPPARAELVDIESDAWMSEELVPSITLDLMCRIARVDYLAPDAVPADSVGERYSGTVVLSEVREWVEAPMGPVSRSSTWTAYLTDGTAGETWARSVTWRGTQIDEQGYLRRCNAVRRLTSWATAAAGGDDAAVVAVATWAATYTSAIDAFERLASPAMLLGIVQSDSSTWWSATCASIGIDLGDGIDTVRDACVAVLGQWVPS